MRKVSNADDAVRERLWAILADDAADPAGAADPSWSAGSDPDAVRARDPARPRGVPPPSTGSSSRDHSVQGADDAPATGALTALGAFDPGRRGVRVLAVVAAVVVLVAAVLAWQARPTVDPVPAVPEPVAAVGTVTVAASAPGPPGEVVVAVAGRVRNPGLVRLPAGSRVADAIEGAGGARPGVDPALLNLARRLVDGELIVVGTAPSPGGGVPGSAAQIPGSAAQGSVAPGAVPPVGGSPAGGSVNLNTATLADLDTLPGVGPVLAQRILDHRAQHGGFRSVGDLRKVDGIGSSRFEQLKDLVGV